MPPEARQELILEFVAEHDMPLPPLAIWAGMNRQYRVTFSYRTLNNDLADLVDAGEMIRVNTTPLKKNGAPIEPLEGDPRNRKSYYFVTDAGVARIADDSH